MDNIRYRNSVPVYPCKTCIRGDAPTQDIMSNESSPSSISRSTLPGHLSSKPSESAFVPKRVQSGPTCGLYALGMVMDHWTWSKSCQNTHTAYVKDDDKTRHFAMTIPREIVTGMKENLFDLAFRNGFTTVGEMFDVYALAKLATKYGYNAHVIRPLSYTILKKYTNCGVPVMVAYDTDDYGHPIKAGGERAHRAVVQTVYVENATPKVVAKHAWFGDEYVWSVSDLLDSNRQLAHNSFPAAAVYNLRDTLATRGLAVWPKHCDHGSWFQIESNKTCQALLSS